MFRKMYFHLFNAVSKAIELITLGQNGEAKELLVNAQQETEETYISASEKKS